MSSTRDPDSWRGFMTVNEAIPVIASCNLHGGLRFNKEAHSACSASTSTGSWTGTSSRWTSGATEGVKNHASSQQVSKWVCDTLFEETLSPIALCNTYFRVTESNWGLTATKQLRLDKNTVARGPSTMWS